MINEQEIFSELLQLAKESEYDPATRARKCGFSAYELDVQGYEDSSVEAYAQDMYDYYNGANQ